MGLDNIRQYSRNSLDEGHVFYRYLKRRHAVEVDYAESLGMLAYTPTPSHLTWYMVARICEQTVADLQDRVNDEMAQRDTLPTMQEKENNPRFQLTDR